jgi:hypothetical protein|tara:strand:+ start:3430 stop:4275 length:846 start_codon:yes stop_codon:yes gene_type:complete
MNNIIKNKFDESPYGSDKHSSYFYAYEKLFSKYVNKKITFVEVGILNGGSLFMWREYFGKEARIIGIDNNPEAKIWEDHGFEIFIGDQANSVFWENFIKKIGKVDILLDDGGHTDLQQATTLFEFINNIKDGGMLVVEDVHTSYLEEFGNPSKLSFINLTFNLINKLNFRSGVLKKFNSSSLRLPVSEIRYFESIVAFEVDRKNASISYPIKNNGKRLNIKDFRHKNTDRENIDIAYRKFRFIQHIPVLGKILKIIMTKLIRLPLYSYAVKKDKKKIKKYY